LSILPAFFLLLLPGMATPFPDVLLVVDDSGDVLRVFDAKSGAVARLEARVGRGPHEIEVLADGRAAAVSNFGTSGEPGRTLTLVEIDLGRPPVTIDLGERTQPYGLEALPDGRLLVAAEGTRELLVVHPREGRVVRRIPMGREGYQLVVATRNGSRAFLSSARAGLVTAVDLSPVRILRDLVTGRAPVGMDLTPDGKRLWVTGPETDSVWLIDAVDPGIFPRMSARGYPTRVKITPDGKYALVSCTQTGDIAVFDVALRREVKRIPIAGEALRREGPHLARGADSLPGPIDLLIEPSGRSAWVISENTPLICRVDLETLMVSGSVNAGRAPGALAGRFAR
jgi:DNA-binding beta-propeller fold protein YncE